MTTALLLLALGVLGFLTLTTGGTLALLGQLRKRRKLRNVGVVLFLSSMVVLVSCFIWASVKVVRRVNGVHPKRYLQTLWHGIVDAAFDDKAVRPTSPVRAKQMLSNVLGQTNVLQGVGVQGMWHEIRFSIRLMKLKLSESTG
jgi:hypothetical protein